MKKSLGIPEVSDNITEGFSISAFAAVGYWIISKMDHLSPDLQQNLMAVMAALMVLGLVVLILPFVED